MRTNAQKSAPPSSDKTNKKFDLAIAYRLLISAYIRSDVDIEAPAESSDSEQRPRKS